jgi:NAD(P)-dependent dehydrogenase (short-subunit alcohol dehydrogenase family)
MPLRDQVVLVTGCSTGIGRALALELKARGHRPFATARRVETLADLAAAGIETLRLDVNDPTSVRDAVGAVIAAAGRVDVLVNNAGINVFGPILEVDVADVRSVLETNVVGLVAVTQAVFPHMADRRRGRIINVGSVVGILPTPFAAAYCASKTAVHMLSDVMRMETAPLGVDVVLVQPGGVRSQIAESGSRGLERFERPSSRYHKAYAGIRKRAGASQDGAMPAEEFARKLVARALADRAPRVVRLGTGADVYPRLAKLPPAVRDSVLSRRFGLTALSAQRGR